MAYNTVSIVKDVNGKPVPQIYNPETDNYEVLEGKYGASKSVELNRDGSQKPMTIYLKSTDTKITSGKIKGDTIFEIDTGEVYMFDGNGWVII